MRVIDPSYFNVNIWKQVKRHHWIGLGIGLVMAGLILELQSLRYGSSIPILLDTGRQIWWGSLSMMMRSLAVWALVLGTVFPIQLVNRPAAMNGRAFWISLFSGLGLGVLLPFALLLAGGIFIFLPLGLLSVFIKEIFPYATLQFAWLAAAYLVFIWIVVGMPPLLATTFWKGRWYYKFLTMLLFFELVLDILQAIVGAFSIILKNSLWQTNDTALVIAVFGSLAVTIAAVLLSLRQLPVLTAVYTITAIYIASLVTGNFSDRLLHWGEVPSAILTLVAPLLYLYVAKWTLRKDGTAAAGLAAGFAGLLAGLLIMQLLHLRIAGQGWISLLYGILFILGLGLALGVFLGRRFINLLTRRIPFQPIITRFLDIGLIAGLMTGMLLGGWLAR